MADTLMAARERMLRDHLEPRGIDDPRVLDAIRAVPRERFVPPNLAVHAYEDHPLQLGHGQTISQPYIVAATAQAAQIGPEDVVLDIGTGSGYAAAVLAHLAARVVSIERIAELSAGAGQVLRDLGYDSVELIVGDGMAGAPTRAPYDAIVCAAASDRLPDAWMEQLAPEGRIVAPLGGRTGQRLIRRRRSRDGTITDDDLGGVMFVPLVSGD